MLGIDIDPSLIDRARKNLEFFHALHFKTDGPRNSKETAAAEGSDEGAEAAEDLDRESEAFPISFPLCLGPLPILDRTSFPGNVSFKVLNFVASSECEPARFEVIMW
jgi:hypothetical protein